jgi:cytochrome P450
MTTRKIVSITGLAYFKSIRAFKKNPLKAMEEIRRDYGYLPYFGGPLKTLFLFHPKDIKTLLVDEKANNEKGDQAKLLKVALGESLFTAEGEEWRRKKLIIQGVFHIQAIQGYASQIQETTKVALEGWKQKGRIQLDEEMMALAFEISSKIFFGGISLEDSTKIRKAFYVLGKILARKFSSPMRLPLWIPSPDHRLLQEQIEILDQFTFSLIRQKRLSPDSEDQSFLGRLIASPEDLSDRQIRDEVVTFLGAGYETTAMLMTWTLFLLLKNPEFIVTFLAAPARSLERKNILNEGLRLYPSFPINVRQNIGPFHLEDQLVPARTNLLISPFLVQRDSAFWADPLRFHPDRHLETVDENLRGRFIPFLMGPKKCIGEILAYEEAELVLETILQSVDLELLTPHVDPVCDILLYPQEGISVKVKP